MDRHRKEQRERHGGEEGDRRRDVPGDPLDEPPAPELVHEVQRVRDRPERRQEGPPHPAQRGEGGERDAAHARGERAREHPRVRLERRRRAQLACLLREVGRHGEDGLRPHEGPQQSRVPVAVDEEEQHPGREERGVAADEELGAQLPAEPLHRERHEGPGRRGHDHAAARDADRHEHRDEQVEAQLGVERPVDAVDVAHAEGLLQERRVDRDLAERHVLARRPDHQEEDARGGQGCPVRRVEAGEPRRDDLRHCAAPGRPEDDEAADHEEELRRHRQVHHLRAEGGEPVPRVLTPDGAPQRGVVVDDDAEGSDEPQAVDGVQPAAGDVVGRDGPSHSGADPRRSGRRYHSVTLSRSRRIRPSSAAGAPARRAWRNGAGAPRRLRGSSRRPFVAPPDGACGPWDSRGGCGVTPAPRAPRATSTVP